MIIVHYKTLLCYLGKKICKMSRGSWLSYLRVTDSWNVPLFLGCRPQGWIDSKMILVHLLQHVSESWAKTFPLYSSENIFAAVQEQIKHLCLKSCSHYQIMNITVRFMNIVRYPWKSTTITTVVPLNVQSPISSPVLSKHFSIWEMKKICLSAEVKAFTFYGCPRAGWSCR